MDVNELQWWPAQRKTGVTFDSREAMDFKRGNSDAVGQSGIQASCAYFGHEDRQERFHLRKCIQTQFNARNNVCVPVAQLMTK
jgi:hypothetical protein